MKNEIINLWNIHLEKQETVELYTALQLLLQQVAESFVLFDRMYFLQEHHHEVNIIPVMSRSLSPRNCAMVSSKTVVPQ